MNKPTTIVINETKQQIAEALNNSKLHPYVMDAIMKELYEEVHSVYLQTARAEKLEYEQSLKESEDTIEK